MKPLITGGGGGRRESRLFFHGLELLDLSPSVVIGSLAFSIRPLASVGELFDECIGLSPIAALVGEDGAAILGGCADETDTDLWGGSGGVGSSSSSNEVSRGLGGLGGGLGGVRRRLRGHSSRRSHPLDQPTD